MKESLNDKIDSLGRNDLRFILENITFPSEEAALMLDSYTDKKIEIDKTMAKSLRSGLKWIAENDDSFAGQIGELLSKIENQTDDAIPAIDIGDFSVSIPIAYMMSVLLKIWFQRWKIKQAQKNEYRNKITIKKDGKTISINTAGKGVNLGAQMNLDELESMFESPSEIKDLLNTFKPGE